MGLTSQLLRRTRLEAPKRTVRATVYLTRAARDEVERVCFERTMRTKRRCLPGEVLSEALERLEGDSAAGRSGWAEGAERPEETVKCTWHITERAREYLVVESARRKMEGLEPWSMHAICERAVRTAGW